MAIADALNVEVVYCPRPGAIDRVTLALAPGATVADALLASGLPQRLGLGSGLASDSLKVGIWGRLCERGDLLRDRDRVELYRDLLVDPKEARRLRYKQHLERVGRA